MADAILGLGSNIGDRAGFLTGALRAIDSRADCSLVTVSSAYRTRPWGKTDQGEFINLCARVETSLSPIDLLDAVKGIEVDLGRSTTERWGPREIDIDVLVMGTLQVDAPKLTLPHPRIGERLFVLMPLAEIAPDLMIDGAGVSALAEALATASHPKACVMDTGITARIKAAISGA